MGNGERSSSGSRSDWRVRLAIVVGTAAGAATALLVRAMADLDRFWPERGLGRIGFGMIAFGIVTGVGGGLGWLVGRLLFRSSPGPADPASPG
jgi:hypothetical protein